MQFTTPEGITYQITNVAIHQPGIAALDGLPSGVNYTPNEQRLTSVGSPAPGPKGHGGGHRPHTPGRHGDR